MSTKCPKCDGKGYIHEYGHVANGVCFLCNGKGIVASNGKAITSVKTTQLRYTLAGMNKRETKMLVDCVLARAEYVPDDTNRATFDKWVSLGHYRRVEKDYYTSRGIKHAIVYIPAEYFTVKSIEILIDWSK